MSDRSIQSTCGKGKSDIIKEMREKITNKEVIKAAELIIDFIDTIEGVTRTEAEAINEDCEIMLNVLEDKLTQ